VFFVNQQEAPFLGTLSQCSTVPDFVSVMIRRTWQHGRNPAPVGNLTALTNWKITMFFKGKFTSGTISMAMFNRKLFNYQLVGDCLQEFIVTIRYQLLQDFVHPLF